MYLCETSRDVEIISSKSSEMNVLIPKGNGDYVNFKSLHTQLPNDFINYLLIFQTEKPIPEQYKTTIKGNALNTICVESLG